MAIGEKQRLAAMRAERRKMSLQDFIVDVESRHFRTNQDTGANANALMIWNMVRDYAGLDELDEDDLRQRHVDSSDSVESVEELEEFERWYEEYSLFSTFPLKKQRYDEIVAKGGYDYLMGRLSDDA